MQKRAPIYLHYIGLISAHEFIKWLYLKKCSLRIVVKTWKNAIVEYFDYQVPVTQLKGPKENGDMQAVKRD